MKISVYGATGFVGSVFCKLFPEDTIKIRRDARNPESREILYLISTTSNYNVLESLKLDIEVNLLVLMEVLEACKEQDIIFNFVSSGFVYGNDIIDASEEDCCNPSGFYSITKRAAESLLISFCKTFNVKYRILRLANVFGTEDQESSGKKNALGFLVNNLKDNKDINLYDGGEVLRDYMHVEDVCRAIRLVMEKGETDTIYNLATGKPKKFVDIIKYAKEYLNSSSRLIPIETPEFYRLVQAKNFTLDVTKFKALGFDEKITIEDGIKMLCR
jgi:nucleoside-diphosphate-sugar epimerase